MTITGEGNNGGDPAAYCDRLTVEAANWHEAQRLAPLYVTLGDPETRAEVLDAAEYILAQKRAAADPALA